MSNQLSTNPMIIDTPDADALFNQYINIKKFRFVDYQVASQTVELQDQDGNLIAVVAGNPDLTPGEQVGPERANGLLVPLLKADGTPNLASGKLMVFFN